MKLLLVVVAMSIFALTEAHEDKYTDKYDGHKDKYTDKYDGQEDKYTDKHDGHEDKYTDKYDGREDKYTDKYDGMDIDEVLSNKRLVNAYSKCVLDQGKCTPEAKELKSHISEALQNGCAKCTTNQKHGMKKVIKHFINKEHDTWKQMVEKYDPKGQYSNKYEKEMKSILH